jgi:hypothetical protein
MPISLLWNEVSTKRNKTKIFFRYSCNKISINVGDETAKANSQHGRIL